MGASNQLDDLFQNKVFYNWIATDEQIAGLISRELASRVSGPLSGKSNVVVLLSEQDSYYGRELADVWMDALVHSNVCLDPGNVWQFSYLRGLDGSKPESENSEQSPASADTPEAALETVLTQQREGQRADGDAQLDYIIRLADFLKKRDDRMKEEGTGRIIAFGFTGSDTYDKLILLEELRNKFPEAVFFTSDLDSTLWTSKEEKYTRNLLVGSAYLINPSIDEDNLQPGREEFSPFRDVYQTAVFKACFAAVDAEETGSLEPLQPGTNDLRGAMYKIGRYGPVMLTDAENTKSPDYDSIGSSAPSWPLLIGTGALVVILGYFMGSFSGGIVWKWKRMDNAGSPATKVAEEMEVEKQIDLRSLLKMVCAVLLAVLGVRLFYGLTRWIALTPGEEPWSLSEGISIWPTEYLRFLVVIGGGLFFFYIAAQSRIAHVKELWKNYFCESEPSVKTDKDWKDFSDKCRQRWKYKLSSDPAKNIIETEARRLWEKGGRPDEENAAKWMQEAELKLKQEQEASLLGASTPPLETHLVGTQTVTFLNTANLFRSYLRLGQAKFRLRRTLFSAFFYLAAMVCIVLILHDSPTFLLIRGVRSHHFDLAMLYVLMFFTQLVLFWVLDCSVLTKRVLDYLSRHPAYWPDPPRRSKAAEFGVGPGDTGGLVSVDFAAVQTSWAAPMILWPILLQLLLVLSRASWFDDWTWPHGLILIFVMNFLMAIMSWWLVRRAARSVQKKVLDRLDETILTVKISPRISLYDILEPETSNKISVTREIYLKNLKRMREEIATERRGAFANWFQDPSYLAVFIPSGATGIITLLATYLLRK
jgi:hypothetical protein